MELAARLVHPTLLSTAGPAGHRRRIGFRAPASCNGANHLGDFVTVVSDKVVVPVVIVVMAVTAVALVVLANRDDTRAAGGSTATSRGPGRLTPAEASRLADDVTSGDEERVRAAVAVSPEQPLDAGAISGLAAIETMSFDVRTFHDVGDGTAEVTARVVVAGGKRTVWMVRLVAVEREWLISSAEPAR